MDSLREHASQRLHTKKSICDDHFDDDDDLKDLENKSPSLKHGEKPTDAPMERDNSSNSLLEEDPLSDYSWADECMSNSSMTVENSQESEPTGQLHPSKSTTTPTIITLKKRLLDSEKLNSRLKRAVDRLRRQNVKFKNKLIEKESSQA